MSRSVIGRYDYIVAVIIDISVIGRPICRYHRKTYLGLQ